jgi:hypothetical protein
MNRGSTPVRTRAGRWVDGRSLSLSEKALILWPRLDRQKLGRCRGDPRRMVALISRRTSLPRSAILAMLLGTAVDEAEIEIWFG